MPACLIDERSDREWINVIAWGVAFGLVAFLILVGAIAGVAYLVYQMANGR